ncbi:MAG: TonB-dependent siderophore receptor [Mesorhizobium sp.]
MPGTKALYFLKLTLVASSILGSFASGSPASAQASQTATQSFNIPAQPLSSALTTFARQTGLKIAYPAALTAGKTSQSLRGSLTASEGLDRLLRGSGLSYEFTGAGAITIVNPLAAVGNASASADGTTVLDPVVVQGSLENAWGPVNGIIANNSASGTRTNTPIIETPQTVNVVGGEQMQQQGVTTVGEALRYTPGVVTGTAGGQADRHDSYFVRGEGGFSANAQYASMLDGMRWRFTDRTTVQIDPWMLERVEVVKGPSSALFGAGTPGGTVNLISKRPSFERKNQVFASGGSFGSAAAGIDLTGPINDQLAYRIVGLARTGGNGIDYQEGERYLIAPSLTWAPTDATSVTLSMMYQRDPKANDSGFLPAYGSVLPIPGYGKVDASFWQGDPNWNEYSRTESSVGLEVKHAFNENWKVTGKLRYGRLESTTKALDYAWMADQITMARTIYLAEHHNESINGDFYTEGEFSTGALDHKVVAGVDYQRLTGGHDDGWNRFNYPTIDIFNPVYGIDPGDVETFREFKQPFRQTGVYAQDQIAYENWRFLGGLRYDQVDATTSTLVTLNGSEASASISDSALTGRIGAVYLFDNGIAPFVSYSTSFNPQPAYKYDGSMLRPYTGEMWEGGVRYQSADDTLFLGATAFWGKKDGVGAQATCDFPEASPIDRCYTDDTRSSSNGIELEARAQLFDGLDIIAAATWQNVRWKEYAGESVDLHIVGVPDFTTSLWLNYKIPEGNVGHGWNFGGGVRYVGKTFATDNNVWGATEYEYEGLPSEVPSFTVFDASVGYDFGALDSKFEGMGARLSVTNLFDKHYVAACNGFGTCSYGKRREISLSMNYTW